MNHQRQWLLVGGGVVVLAGGLVASQRYLAAVAPITVGTRAPEFRAVTTDATPRDVTLATYAGQVVVLNIWATWCVPCRFEMPSIEALYREFGPRGLKVVAVSIDEPGSADAIRAFGDEYQLTFDLVHDPTRAIEQTYQTYGIPETYVIGRDGLIRKRRTGAANWNSAANRALIAGLLGVPDSLPPTAARSP